MTTPKTETMGDSISDLLANVTTTAINLAYLPDLMTTRQSPIGMSDELWDDVWSYADGLPQQRIDRTLNGRCSQSAFLAFDLHDEETHLKKVLIDFNKYTPNPLTNNPTQAKGD